MPRFYPLRVADIRRDTRDSVVLTLEPRSADRARFTFIQGQYLTFRQRFDGAEVRRSYSICAGRSEELLRVGIKRVEGGCFSNWANSAVEVGDVLEAMPPMGNFHVPIEAGRERYYLGFAGGSGITPVLGIVRTVLAEEPCARFTLVYGNRSAADIMFREELEDLKNQHLGRFSILHILESGDPDGGLFTGRLDAGKCRVLFGRWIAVADADFAFICGPQPMMLAVAAALREHGLEDSRIKIELFTGARKGRATRPASPASTTAAATAGVEKPCAVTILLDGAAASLTLTRTPAKDGPTILEAALDADLDAPHACRAGVCSTCRAMVLEGEVEMAANHALEDYEIQRGYVLTCQSRPVSDTVVVDYDR